LHHHAERWLRDKALFGSPGELAVVVERNDVFELLKIHIDAVYAKIEYISLIYPLGWGRFVVGL